MQKVSCLWSVLFHEAASAKIFAGFPLLFTSWIRAHEMKYQKMISLALLSVFAGQVLADTTDARCDIYPAGEDHTNKMIPCTFSQRQGHVTINRSDGVRHELSPVVGTSGNFEDQDGQTVYRQGSLRDQGLIFRFPNESVFIYWNTAALRPDDSDNPTYPFSTADYDATTLLRCRAAGTSDFVTCPAGILRMEDRQASIVIISPAGETFTINFLTEIVNATNREVDAELNGDLWTVTIENGDKYEVPLSAIEGG